MKYALLIYSPPGTVEALSEAESQSLLGEYMAVGQSPGVLGGDQLQSHETATTVRVHDGEVLTTDGPFADTKEILGGFFLVDVDDLDAALAIAGRIPAARMGGSVEVRPIVER
jgi:hypothetical protein